jgi:hypothetical protein
MSDAATPATSTEPTTASPTDDPSQGQGGSGTGATPPGYVPVTDFEAHRRQTQSVIDRLQARLDAVEKPKEDSGKTTETSATPVDPGRLVADAVSQVYRAGEMREAAAALKTEFKYADPAIFSTDRLSQFQSPEALRFAVQDSHARVAAILDAERAAADEATRTEQATTQGGASGPAGSTQATQGDPTIAQLNAMTFGELDAAITKDPELPQRVMARGV